MVFIDLTAAFALLVATVPAEAPEDAFAQAVVSRAADGWRLRDVQVDNDAGNITTRLTYVLDGEATRLSLTYDPQRSMFRSFAETSAELPDSNRTYRYENELAAALSVGSPDSIEQGCSDSYLAIADDGIMLATDDWYVVERAADGNAAGRLLGQVLADHLDDNAELMDVSEVLDDDGATVTRWLEMVLVSDSDTTVVRIELADDGSITQVEARSTPSALVNRRYRYTDRVRNSVIGKAVSELVLVRDKFEALSRLELVLAGGDTVAIDMADFEQLETGCGC